MVHVHWLRVYASAVEKCRLNLKNGNFAQLLDCFNHQSSHIVYFRLRIKAADTEANRAAGSFITQPQGVRTCEGSIFSE